MEVLLQAKSDTQDLWKIYYQLQTELQQSYEKNATLSKEKEQIQTQYNDLKSEYDKVRSESLHVSFCCKDLHPVAGTVDPVKLKEALIAMQKEKLEMQKRFNDIVIVNKQLREKEARYGPRLAEIDKALANIEKVRTEATEVYLLMIALYTKHHPLCR